MFHTNPLAQDSPKHGPRAACGPRLIFVRPVTFYVTKLTENFYKYLEKFKFYN
jgi:hypothetical protein